MTTTPQDHKPKADASFTFKAAVTGKDGKAVTRTFTLPKATEEHAMAIPGEITHAVIMNPDDEMAQMRLAFATLEKAGPTEAAHAALLSLSTKEMLEILGTWMGESSGSSD